MEKSSPEGGGGFAGVWLMGQALARWMLGRIRKRRENERDRG